ncbi:MAG: zinc-binding alcohol dehydrogenase family protein [Frankiaceae bacterium]|jgi:NADPH2:quinone reductase|nr:zinc-binding alcohol dehydrogenase family protein [Frankiaceae bacterium]
MLALQINAPAADASTTRVVEITSPTPRPGEVSIDIAYAGVNFKDVMTRRGDPGYAPDGWPLVPGFEVAGIIRALGPGVANFDVGDKVAANVLSGGLAEVVVTPANLVARVPEGLDLASAAAAPLMLSTAILMLKDAAQLRAGERVFMHSASGGVGSVAAQVARALGSGVRVGTVARPNNVESARAAGWDIILPQDGNLLNAAREASTDGFDVILDPTGTTSLDFDLKIAAPGARVILFGNSTGASPSALPPFASLVRGNIGLVGFSISALCQADPARVTNALAAGLMMLKDGRVRLPLTVIDSLGETPAVHDLLATRAGQGKYVTRIASTL